VLAVAAAAPLLLAWLIRRLSGRAVARAGERERGRLRGLPFNVAVPEAAFRETAGDRNWLVVEVQLAPGHDPPRIGVLEDLLGRLEVQGSVDKASDRTYRLRTYLGDDADSAWWGNRRALLRFHALVDAVLLPLHAVHPIQRVRFQLD
jgi:hypothetical protein